MRVLNESIARQANREDHCTGRFWEGRFRSQALLDDAAILACMTYVDLNPIRAGMAESAEDSDFTAIQARLRQFAESRQTEAATPADPITDQPADLLPFIGGEHADSGKGITFSLPDYLQLVDWTSRAVRDDKRGAIPAHIQPIFQRMGINHEEWLEIVQNFGRRYLWRRARWIGCKLSVSNWADTGSRRLAPVGGSIGHPIRPAADAVQRRNRLTRKCYTDRRYPQFPGIRSDCCLIRATSEGARTRP